MVGALDAEDVVQTAYTKAYKSVSSFRGDADPQTWLYSITRNCALDFLRQRKRKPEHPLPQRPQFSYETSFDVRLKHEDAPLQHWLGKISAHDRTTLQAALTHPTREAAAASIGITTAALKSRLNRAKRRLRKAYADAA